MRGSTFKRRIVYLWLVIFKINCWVKNMKSFPNHFISIVALVSHARLGYKIYTFYFIHFVHVGVNLSIFYVLLNILNMNGNCLTDGRYVPYDK